MASTQSESDRPASAMRNPMGSLPGPRRSALVALLTMVALVLVMSAPMANAQHASGEPSDEEVATAADTTDEGDHDEGSGETVPGVPDEVLQQGAAVYTGTCSSCHQPGGVGIDGKYPPLLDNPNVTDVDYVREVIIDGRTGEIEVNGIIYDVDMPSFSTLAAEDIDALAIYVSNGFAAPVVEGVDFANGADDVGSIPALANTAYLIAMLIALGVFGYVFYPRIVGQVDRLEMPWLDASLKAGVIVVGFIVFTVFVPNAALRTGYVANLGDFGQNIVGVGLWGGALLAGIGVLWYAHRDRRI